MSLFCPNTHCKQYAHPNPLAHRYGKAPLRCNTCEDILIYQPDEELLKSPDMIETKPGENLHKAQYPPEDVQ